MIGAKRWRQGIVFCLGALLAVGMQLLPAIAQGEPESETAAIVLDGVPLFQVAPAAELTAQERATMIQRQLEDLLQRHESFDVDIEVRRGVPVLFINDAYLMSVTQADASQGEPYSTFEQADRWRQIAQQALERSRTERQESYIVRSLTTAVGLVLAAALGHWISGRLWRRWVRPMVKKITHLAQGEDAHLTGLNLLLRFTLFLVRASIWLAIIYYITNLFPLTRQATYVIMQGLIDGLLARSLILGNRNYSVIDLVILLGLLLGLVIISSAAANLLKSRFLRITGINRGAQEAISVLAKYTLVFFGGVVILQIWGLDLSSLALIASALGVGIGLGMQNIAKDFISGLIMVFERPVQVGDFVDFGNFLGTIERIGARSTEIRTLDHVSIIVPNSRFLEQEVINWSHRNPVSRLRLPVGVSYSADPPMVREALLDACKGNPQILQSPAPQVFFKGFGDSALEFELLVWIALPHQQMIISSELYFAVEASLKRYGVEVPFPQRDLHIRTGSLPIDVSPKAQHWLDSLASLHRPADKS